MTKQVKAPEEVRKYWRQKKKLYRERKKREAENERVD